MARPACQRQLAKSFSHFEPLARRVRLGPIIADRLVSMGLAEIGPAEPPYVKCGDGYRLTKLGWKVLDRGRRPNLHTLELKPKPRMLGPLLKPFKK
jgi:hypothetical protein